MVTRVDYHSALQRAIPMTLLQITILAIVQGLAELLPVSSSAHVIFAEKLLKLDPTAPDMTLMLVMLHTGTMFAVIVYFWRSWRETYFSSSAALKRNGWHAALATAATGVVAGGLFLLIKHVIMRDSAHFEIEQLFGNTKLVSIGLAAAGLLIIASSKKSTAAIGELDGAKAAWMGAIQGLCLPFRGFSRSGATISTGMLLNVQRRHAEEFSFALAVILTPAVIAKEGYRFYKAHAVTSGEVLHLLGPSLAGMVLSFFAGLIALRWLSGWLEHGRWYWFGWYCLVASLAMLTLGG